jgi:hypothetical protein
VLAVTLASSLEAQDNSIFPGAGLRSFSDSDAMATERSSPRTRLFDFDTGDDFDSPDADSSHRSSLSWFGKRQQSDIFDSEDDNTAADWLRPRTKFSLFPKRHPSQPNFFQRANAKTKDFVERTSQDFGIWAAQTNRNWRNRTNETWSAITKAFQGSASSDDAQPPAQPPLRTARDYGDQPKVRF